MCTLNYKHNPNPSLGTRLFAHGGRVWNTAHTRVVLCAPHMGCRISSCEPLCLHYVIIIVMHYVITLYFFYITHHNYNDVMYTLWFPPTYGPLARRTTRVWAVFQTLPPCAKSLVPRLPKSRALTFCLTSGTNSAEPLLGVGTTFTSVASFTSAT